MSLIVALDYVGACLESKGDQAPFVAIVQTFEDAFNINTTYYILDRFLWDASGNYPWGAVSVLVCEVSPHL
jgi:hypothetical protein